MMKGNFDVKKRAVFLAVFLFVLLVLEFLPYASGYYFYDDPFTPHWRWTSYFGIGLPEFFLFPAGILTVLATVYAVLFAACRKTALRILTAFTSTLAFVASLLLQIEGDRVCLLGILITAGLLLAAVGALFGFREPKENQHKGETTKTAKRRK